MHSLFYDTASRSLRRTEHSQLTKHIINNTVNLGVQYQYKKSQACIKGAANGAAATGHNLREVKAF